MGRLQLPRVVPRLRGRGRLPQATARRPREERRTRTSSSSRAFIIYSSSMISFAFADVWGTASIVVWLARWRGELVWCRRAIASDCVGVVTPDTPASFSPRVCNLMSHVNCAMGSDENRSNPTLNSHPPPQTARAAARRGVVRTARPAVHGRALRSAKGIVAAGAATTTNCTPRRDQRRRRGGGEVQQEVASSPLSRVSKREA